MTRVLVVDDDLHIRRLARLVLLSAGFDVQIAGDGEEALSILDHEDADVIVLDLNMPVMDGRAFFHKVEEYPHRPHILIMSADQADSARLELGAEASLCKPFLPDELVAKVQQLSRAA